MISASRRGTRPIETSRYYASFCLVGAGRAWPDDLTLLGSPAAGGGLFRDKAITPAFLCGSHAVEHAPTRHLERTFVPAMPR
jgi:hypothetical protein